MQTPRLDYYTNTWLNAEMKLPEKLPAPRVNAELVFTLTAGGKTVSENSCDIVLATQDWVQAGNPSGEAIRAFDPHGVAKETFDGLNVALNDSLDNLDPAKPLIIADLGAWMGAPGGAEKVKAFVEAGGRALILQAGAELPKLFPDQIKSFRKTAGEIVTSEIPESPVFDGIEPLDMAWFEMGPDQAPYACDGTYRIDDRRDDVSALAAECDVHGYLKKPQDVVNLSGAPLVEIRLGKGVVLASEMMLSAKKKDPIASRLLGNFIRFIVSDKTSTSGG